MELSIVEKDDILEISVDDKKFEYNIADDSIDFSKFIEYISKQNEEIKINNYSNEICNEKSNAKYIIKIIEEIIHIFNETYKEIFDSDN